MSGNLFSHTIIMLKTTPPDKLRQTVKTSVIVLTPLNPFRVTLYERIFGVNICVAVFITFIYKVTFMHL